MSRVVHPDFQSGQDYPQRHPNILVKTISRYQLVELFLIIGAIFLLWGGSAVWKLHSIANQALPAWLEAFRIEIIDGDSIRSGGQVYRLVGFDTPESGNNAKCAHERALSAAATQRLKELTAGGDVDLRRVACACPPGTEGSGQCNYGRFCGTLSVGGKDVGTILIAEGLAVPYVCDKTSCPQRKSWCAS